MKGSTKCGCGCNLDITESFKFFLESIDRHMVEKTGHEIIIESGARCEAYNKKIGGNPNSAHKLGVAADILFQDSNKLWHLMDIIHTLRIQRIGDGINRGFIHIDMANKMPSGQEYPQFVIWKY